MRRQGLPVMSLSPRDSFPGAVSKTATAPLETVRMQMMTGKKVCPQRALTCCRIRLCCCNQVRLQASIGPDCRLCMRMLQGSVLDVVRSTWAQGGVLGFFSGNEAGTPPTVSEHQPLAHWLPSAHQPRRCRWCLANCTLRGNKAKSKVV